MRDRSRQNLWLSAAGAALGLAYGLIIRASAMIASEQARSNFDWVMSIAFIFMVPFAMGFCAVFWVERREDVGYSRWVVIAILPVLAGVVLTTLLYLEGWICDLFFLPAGLVLSVIGGALGGFAGRRSRKRQWGAPLLICILTVPMIAGPMEEKPLLHTEVREVASEIDIHATADEVWTNIERVRRIDAEELPSMWTQRIGFPRPVEATLSFGGVGGVRHASFEKGVMFIETVDEWEPQRRLGFSIHAEPIPASTLDEHVTIGGKYFDVLRGEYWLEPLSGGVVRLHLNSHERVSTDFNWYAQFWSDAVMSDVQRGILQVIKKRCEERGVLRPR